MFPSMRMYGGDAVVPSRWVTIKGEGGYFTSDDLTADDYVLYVIELERQQGELLRGRRLCRRARDASRVRSAVSRRTAA